MCVKFLILYFVKYYCPGAQNNSSNILPSFNPLVISRLNKKMFKLLG
uniref:Uncharacterized protein n=1 Tax=Meloidogyne enterolobii TaxID=390850 RepID=A0A6V7VB45_MELEN|nr:unnamed protein product [Meloidogyne enterolobii]